MKPVIVDQNVLSPSLAIDFSHARGRADREEYWARLTGKSADLLSYDDVCQKLKAKGIIWHGLQDIPLDAIVGSVGRWTDFTRSFLPRQDSDQQRWMRVKTAMTHTGGLPPIEVYQIGQVYFVLDGNHRVSVARELGATHIEAYVTEVQTRVPLSADVQSDELIIKAEYADFLERIHLDELRPSADLSVTAPGQYRILEEQVETHWQLMSTVQEHEIQYQETIGSWYDEVYLPVVQTIRQQGILRDFPSRTETDLYVWLSKHRLALAQELGYEIEVGVAIADLVTRFSPTLPRIFARTKEKLLDAVTPDPLEAGPAPGQWRRERLATRQADGLFADILVPINDEEFGWQALEQALEVARREGGRLHALHVVSSEAKRNNEAAQIMQAEFKQRCQTASLSGELGVKVGGVVRQICEQAKWADLVVVSLAHPPASQPLTRLGSKFSTLIRRCPRPILIVPALPGLPSKAEQPGKFKRALLAYDGSPKAEEALLLAAQLCQPNYWNIPLTVVTVTEGDRITLETLGRAQKHLAAHNVQVTFVRESGPVAEAILKLAAAHESDLIIMGSYGFSPMLEIALGSTVDQVLRTSRQPVLICR
jgi:nucleotide-binding universal stress UspA family protein